jgi:hypothetical protein
VVAHENGPVLLSINGNGYIGSDTIGVNKPSMTAKVRKAYLFATTYNGRDASGVIQFVDADVILNSVPIDWDGTATNDIFRSFYADVTSVIKPTVDAVVSVGEVLIDVEEVTNTSGTDGEVLAVIFEDPIALVADNSVSLLFGALSSAGDSFTINLGAPLTPGDINDPNLIMDLSLGIGFGFQSATISSQFSLVVSGAYRDTRKAARSSLTLFLSSFNRM